MAAVQMRILVVCCLPLLTSCGTLMDAIEIVKDPEVQEALIKTATDAATGNWLGAICGIGATVAAVAGHKKIKAIKNRKQT